MSAIVVQIGCLHCGSTVSLCSPSITLPDAGTYRASKAQLEIWRVWSNLWAIVKELRGKRNKKKLIIIINGEIIDNYHHETPQLISPLQTSQLKIAYKVFEPIFALKPDAIYVIRGTEAHSGKDGQWDEAFARDIEAVQDETNEMFSWWWLPLMVEDVLFDIAHHGKSGYREHTGPNALNAIATETMIEYTRTGDRIPDLVLRGHVHRWYDSGKNYPVRVLLNPSWQLQTAHGARIGAGKILPIGGNIIIVDGSEYEVRQELYWPRRRKPVIA